MQERHIVIVAFEGLQPLDAVGPHEVFAGAGRAAAALGRAGSYRVTLASPGGATVRAESGLVLGTAPLPAAVGAHRHPGALRGPGAEAAARDEAVLDFIRRTAPRCRRVATVCSGAFLGAAAGLFDGRRVTTHWARARQLAEDYPGVTVDADPIYIRDGKYWSSAGVTAGIDLSLALVQEDLGVDVAQTVARWLVMFLHRPGGQTQFASPVWVPRAERSTIRAVQSLVEAAPGGDHRLPALAAAAAMSVRHFTRVFTAEVGETPSRFVERTRLEAARRELEETTDTLDVIAARCGLGSAESLRRVFQRHLGVPPDAYRRRFRAAPRRKDVRMTDHLQIAIPLFPKYTALDAVGPYEVLQRIPTFDIVFVGHDRGEVRSENGMIGLTVDATFEDVADARRGRLPRRRGHAAVGARRAGARLGAPGPCRDPVHHLGLHRFGRARRGRAAAGADGHHALVLLPRAGRPRRRAHADAGGRAPGREDHHVGRRLERHRHGAAAGRAAGRPHRGPGGPAHD